MDGKDLLVIATLQQRVMDEVLVCLMAAVSVTITELVIVKVAFLCFMEMVVTSSATRTSIATGMGLAV
jgi:hypothetical protein|tara:strand:+ start:8073 stop:8276 length:204 start_codon:yes stop_codon:yes gene_type:complete